MSSTRHQLGAARRHAVPIVRPSDGGPLIKRTVELGWMLDRRKVRVPIDAEMPPEVRKGVLFRASRQFITEEQRLDGAMYRGALEVHGPFPHFEPRENDEQVGDRGKRRPLARNVREDTGDLSKVDYVIEATFAVRESIAEVPTSLAMDLFKKPGSRPGLRPMRENEWARVWRDDN